MSARTARPDTWMPLYIGDYLGDTLHLTTRQHGAYLLLLMSAWRLGGKLPGDDSALAAIAKLERSQWKQDKPAIAPFFEVTPTAWVQGRLLRELERAEGHVDKRREAGKAGAEARWQKDANASGKRNGKRTAEPMAKRSDGLWQNDGPSPSPSERENPTPPPSPQPASGGPDWARWGVALKAVMAEFWPNDQRVEMAQTGVCATWVADGLDLELDALPTVRSICADMAGKRQPAPNGLKYFDGPIRRRNADRLAGLLAPQPRGEQRGTGAPPADPWDARLQNHRDQLAAGRPLKDTTWHDFHLSWGPMPGEPGCRAPKELVAKYGPWPRKEAA